jgi:hypothetical protein
MTVRPYHGVVMIAGTILMALLSGCAGSFESGSQSFFVQPGKFDLIPCSDIAARINSSSAREKELASLIERANQGAGGQVISAMVYGADMEQVRADLRLLQQTARDKNCNNINPPRNPAEIGPIH